MIKWLSALTRSLPLLLISVATQATEKTESLLEQAKIELHTKMVFNKIPAGCFDMGRDQPTLPRDMSVFNRIGVTISIGEDELPKHKMCLNGFEMAIYEITESQWLSVMHPEQTPAPSALPIRGVNWLTAKKYAEKLTLLADDGYHYRLPTEAEWEYACLAGQPTQDFKHESDVNTTGWYSKDFRQSVGLLEANNFGLHDMLGNVWEWTSSDYRPYKEAQHNIYQSDYSPAVNKVMRGGSYRTTLDQIGCSRRGHSSVTESLDVVGLRLVRVPRNTS